MLRSLLILLVLAAILIAADRALLSRQAEQRAASVAIAPFVPEASRQAGALAAVRVQSGAGENWLYVRRQGLWRCLNWRNAVADAEAVGELVAGVLDAVGVPLSESPPRPQDYGLDVPAMQIVSLHGPQASLLDAQRDRLLAVDLGAAQALGTGSFVRRHGERTVWSIDSTPGAPLARAPGDKLPPLLDRHLVPLAWPGVPARVQTIRVEPPGGTPYELLLQPRAVTDDTPRDTPPVEWLLLVDGQPQERAELLIVFYVNHLLTETWENLGDPALASHLDLEHPRARVTLRSGDAPPLELVLGARLPRAETPVWNSVSEQLCELGEGREPLLFPELATFAPDAQLNPWQAAADRH